jgi:subtilisin-like proprotein convertase family protein
MRSQLLLLVTFANLVLTAQAALYTFNGSPAQAIPDNNPSGVAYAFDFTDAGQTAITDVTVSFGISGGWNGDLYAYLSHNSDTLVLLNRVGVSASSTYGYGDPGMAITLSDAGSVNIHNYGGNGGSQLTGTFKADGQTTSPLAAPASFSATGGSATFGNIFGNTNPQGSWTLFFADVSGGSTATLNSWSVDISAVPEPVDVALGVFAFLFGSTQVFRWCRRRAAR